MSRTDRASRVIAASPATVYGALLDRESLEAWLPPAGMRGRIERWDPRPGGGFRMVLTYLDSVGLIRFDRHPRSGARPRKDVHDGAHGEEETASSPLVHA
ncbi:hypothetical protein Pta02_62270 [Planobispora takensis]|uniref:Activator of Hsp90 ATPase homologue 1/2-like C-terminal domain-containing protein n=1 Tax=Planobispora takensis TaxID=1367882 RepID=A0A8J3TB81_9ACTN|nr:SRPBCC domain-containing protein [Planobispora takensis]GII04219.1 hypothetical protein Pta02_62270 [Planobispora takensis]